MNADRMPKQILFGELEKTRPAHGTKKRWRDAVKTTCKLLVSKRTGAARLRIDRNGLLGAGMV